MSYTSKQINYDDKFDVLYYVCGDTSNSYGDEIDNNIILLRDIATEQVQGITILNFKHIYSEKSAEYTKICRLFDVEEVLNSITY